MNVFNPPDKPESRLQAALRWLTENGYVVDKATDLPGLYHINDGPELTEMQVINFAVQAGFKG
jgi:hypothetical protein